MHVGEPVEPPPVSPARGPPTEWTELVQGHDDRDVMQASPDELPVIDSRPQLVEVPLTVLFFKDLEQRGMLEETLVLWTTEFGRMPSSQGGQGRDHNPFVFTNWLCGGGVRGGITCGESDQWGYKPLDRDHPTTAHDVHATVLKLLGIDHTKLTWRNNGIDRRLTDVHGHVINGILS